MNYFQILSAIVCSLVSCGHYRYPFDPLRRGARHGSAAVEYVENSHPLVSTEAGRVRGYLMKTIRRRPIFAFEGIPYGESTGGENRFQPPVPRGKWDGVREAFKPGNWCLQAIPFPPYVVKGNEDCLFLNVYTPKVNLNKNDTEKLPVLFFIHGGNFYTGSGSVYGPSYLLENDLVLVTINYRLGVFGFLSTGDEASPGNNGLRDQALALKWVHENIRSFGGDPKRITVMGEGTGGASAHLLALSSYGKPYIHSVVAVSGTAMNRFAVRSRVAHQRLVNRMGLLVNCRQRESQDYVDCLRHVDPGFLNYVQLKLYPLTWFPLILFGPAIEPSNLTKYEPVFAKSPEEIYSDGDVPKVPLLVTRNAGEFYFTKRLLKGNGVSRLIFDRIWERHSYVFLDLPEVNLYPGHVMKEVESEYFYNQSLSWVPDNAFDEIVTDVQMDAPVHKAIQLHSKVAPTQALIVSGPIRSRYTGRPTVVLAHGKAATLLFNCSSLQDGYSTADPEFLVSETFTDQVYDFITQRDSKSAEDHKRGVAPVISDPCNVKYLDMSTLTSGRRVRALPELTLRHYQLLNSQPDFRVKTPNKKLNCF